MVETSGIRGIYLCAGRFFFPNFLKAAEESAKVV